MVNTASLLDSTLAKFDPRQVTDDFLASLDIAEVNLACARGLVGAEELDDSACLTKIDEWSEKVRHATARNINAFTREPGRFDGSLGKFFMAVLCTTLQRECGVRYNPERAIEPGDARDSRDRFIHGITHGSGGTCASLPVLYAAIGRRLGYPLRIVQGARHLLLRWDETGSTSPLARDRFNIEATAEGFVSHPDRFYEQWPFPHPDPDIDPRYYLRSLAPREELAVFLCIRSIVLMDNGKFVQAIQPAAWARQLAPDDYSIKVHLEITMLLALGILDEKPPWMDSQPVIRPDGVSWSRYWWPRPMENRELLPAASLPMEVLAGILPADGPDLDVGDLADALYERAAVYADEAYILQVHHAAIARQHHAEALAYNAMNRARRQAVVQAMVNYHPTQPQHPWPYVAKTPAMPSMPGVPQLPAQFANHSQFGVPTHGHPGFTEMELNMAGIPGMLGLPPIDPPAAMHGLLSLATRRPPFPVAALPSPSAWRLG